MMNSQRIVVSSHNPVKISATREGFSRMFPSKTYTILGITVPSGVPDQPFSDDETLQGALNRAHNAREAEPEAEYWIGIEGGVDQRDGELQSFAWVVVLGKEEAGGQGVRMGRARTATFYQPEEVAKLVRAGMELGEADDAVFHSQKSKHNQGSVGLLTGGLIDRSTYYVQAVILALIPFKNADLFAL